MSARWSYRVGVPEDLDGLLAVKAALTHDASLPLTDGGFILGTTPERYAAYLSAGVTRVLEERGALVGFVVVLPDPVLRASDLWAKQDAITWTEPPPDPSTPVAYLDQLAVLPGLARRARGVGMAIDAVRGAFNAGHQLLFATTLLQPRPNPVAIPHIARYGGRRVGTVDEIYPDGLRVTSALYVVERSAFMGCRARAPR